MPASSFRICRTERGMRESRTTSCSTTGSVEARIAPPMNATTQRKSTSSASGIAPSATMIPVPGPSTSAGTTQRRPSSSTCSRTPSRNSTSASVATASRIGSSGASASTSNARSLSANPSAR